MKPMSREALCVTMPKNSNNLYEERKMKAMWRQIANFCAKGKPNLSLGLRLMRAIEKAYQKDWTCEAVHQAKQFAWESAARLLLRDL